MNQGSLLRGRGTTVVMDVSKVFSQTTFSSHVLTKQSEVKLGLVFYINVHRLRTYENMYGSRKNPSAEVEVEEGVGVPATIFSHQRTVDMFV